MPRQGRQNAAGQFYPFCPAGPCPGSDGRSPRGLPDRSSSVRCTMPLGFQFFSACLTACIVGSAFAGTPNSSVLTKSELQQVTRAIKSKQHYDPRYPGGNVLEAEGERIYVEGSSGDNGWNMVAVQFTLEAGNAEYEYLLVLDRKSKRIIGPIRIGGRGYRHVAIYRVERGLIHACSLFYGPNDALPEPTVPGDVAFSVTSGELVESYSVVGVQPIPGCKPKP